MTAAPTDSPDLEIDIRDTSVFAERLPHDWFTWLRRNAPVYNCAKPGEVPMWLISRHEDITKISRATDMFSSDATVGGPVGLDDDERAMFTMLGSQNIMWIDPPDHTRYRRILSGGFTPRAIKRMEATLRSYAEVILDAAVAKGECDFVSDVAAALPLFAIADLLALPDDWRDKCVGWANTLATPDEPEYQQDIGAYFDAVGGMFAATEMLVDRARQQNENTDDVMSLLAHAKVDDEPLTLERLGSTFILFFGAGSETTRNALTHGLTAFADNPDVYAKLAAADSTDDIWDTAVEEILRWASPAIYMRRVVMKDQELRGQQLRTGDSVVLLYPSGNRDESVFENPFSFNIERAPNPHMTFGAGGPHFCLGAPLARLEIKIFFQEFMKRVPEFKLLAPPERAQSNFLNSIKRLQVDLTPND